MFRMSSAWWENSSQSPARVVPLKVPYATTSVKMAQNEVSAIE